MKKIFQWLIKKIINKIIADKNFINFINTAFENYYKEESLRCIRIWGDDSRIHLGSCTQINNALINTVSGDVYISDYVFFGHSVSLLTGTHDHTKKNYNRQSSVPSTGRDIYIGKGVWIGSNATIIGPSQIGEHAVIAAGAVLIGDAEPCSLYAGIPAVKIKNIDFES